ncbi:uncharacterized protein F4807DRAFT_171561 [Annulohypoxylon truncatum]|uniref:uncharacterized protein n=1 Tax=Annulohypoxylon truncatum TaxID=327061 RepID=UPI002008DBA5|nr:uncharacterized protein F4807DRAFT_171561 [Annulohypoxylon truncatum]KAI1207579.1 hypothetical protein F4807DRAFT_171561 [Annulohypoxylon truncatum]
MDALKKFAGKAGGSSGNANTQQTGQQKDYGDKVASLINKKEGGKLSDQQLETGTDKAREMYEKATGNKVDPKYSN